MEQAVEMLLKREQVTVLPKDDAVEDEKLWPGKPVKGKRTTAELPLACFLLLYCWRCFVCLGFLFVLWFSCGKKHRLISGISGP